MVVKMEIKTKKLMVGTVMGAFLGIFCIIGVSLRLPNPVYPNATIYLIGAWYNRVIMGSLIGLAGGIKLYKNENNIINSIIRGSIIGAFVSISFSFLSQAIELSYFFAGIVWGLINDLVTTQFIKTQE